MLNGRVISHEWLDGVLVVHVHVPVGDVTRNVSVQVLAQGVLMGGDRFGKEVSSAALAAANTYVRTAQPQPEVVVDGRAFRVEFAAEQPMAASPGGHVAAGYVYRVLEGGRPIGSLDVVTNMSPVGVFPTSNDGDAHLLERIGRAATEKGLIRTT